MSQLGSLPPGLTYSALARTAVIDIAIVVARAGICLPLIISLIWLTAGHEYRRKTLALHITLFCGMLALIDPFLLAYSTTTAALYPQDGFKPAVFFAASTVTFTMPWFADLVIMLRLLMFYPSTTTSRRDMLLVFSVPCILKLVRIGALSHFLWTLWRDSRNATSLWEIADANGGSTAVASALIEYSCQMVDVGICSLLSLLRLRSILQPKITIVRSRHSQTRLERLFTILVGSFILPAASALMLLIGGTLHNNASYLSNLVSVNASVAVVNIFASSILLNVDTVPSEHSQLSSMEGPHRSPRETQTATSSQRFQRLRKGATDNAQPTPRAAAAAAAAAGVGLGSCELPSARSRGSPVAEKKRSSGSLTHYGEELVPSLALHQMLSTAPSPGEGEAKEQLLCDGELAESSSAQTSPSPWSAATEYAVARPDTASTRRSSTLSYHTYGWSVEPDGVGSGANVARRSTTASSLGPRWDRLAPGASHTTSSPH